MANTSQANSLVSADEILVRFDDRNSESLSMEVYLFGIYACLALRSSFSRANLSISFFVHSVCKRSDGSDGGFFSFYLSEFSGVLVFE